MKRLCALAALFAAICASAHADSIGFRGAVAESNSEENFDAYELFIVFDLPWAWTPGAVRTQTQLEVLGGILDAAGEVGFLGALGPRVAFIADRISFDLGAAAAVLGETEFGEQDFGGSSQFIFHTGLTFALTERLNTGVRYQHISDASIHDGDDLNLLLLEVFYDYFDRP